MFKAVFRLPRLRRRAIALTFAVGSGFLVSRSSQASDGKNIKTEIEELRSVIEEIKPLFTDKNFQAELEEKIEVLTENLLRLEDWSIVLLGTTNSGKSTIINALFGSQIVYTNMVPVRFLVTIRRTKPGESRSYIQAGNEKRFLNMDQKDDRATWIELHPKSSERTRHIEVFLSDQYIRDSQAPMGLKNWLLEGKALIDLPGLDSVFDDPKTGTQRGASVSNVHILVLSNDGITETLVKTRARANKGGDHPTIYLVNKSDIIFGAYETTHEARERCHGDLVAYLGDANVDEIYVAANAVWSDDPTQKGKNQYDWKLFIARLEQVLQESVYRTSEQIQDGVSKTAIAVIEIGRKQSSYSEQRRDECYRLAEATLKTLKQKEEDSDRMIRDCFSKLEMKVLKEFKEKSDLISEGLQQIQENPMADVYFQKEVRLMDESLKAQWSTEICKLRASIGHNTPHSFEPIRSTPRPVTNLKLEETYGFGTGFLVGGFISLCLKIKPIRALIAAFICGVIAWLIQPDDRVRLHQKMKSELLGVQQQTLKSLGTLRSDIEDWTILKVLEPMHNDRLLHLNEARKRDAKIQKFQQSCERLAAFVHDKKQ